jgi:Flp pilus assembly protein TadG
MRLRHDQRGSVAAEFAVIVPAVVLVVLLAVATLAAGGRQIRLEQAAAQGARLAARGEPDDRVREVVAALVDGVRVTVRTEGEFACVDASAPNAAPLALPPLRATGCALAGGL